MPVRGPTERFSSEMILPISAAHFKPFLLLVLQTLYSDANEGTT